MKHDPTLDMQDYKQHIARKRFFLAILLILTFCAFIFYLGIGSMKLSPGDVLRVFAGAGEARHRTAVMSVRLPRATAAVLVGAVLAASGAVMQCVLNNSLASVSTLGVSQGAAFGAAIGIIVFGGGAMTNSNSTAGIAIHNPYIVSLCAFFFGFLCSVIVILLSRQRISGSPAGMVLAGTALSAMFSGGSTLMQYFADDTSLGAVVFWTFGNLGNAGWTDLRFIFAVTLFAFLYFYFNRWNYNAMSVGQETARSLGVNTEQVTPRFHGGVLARFSGCRFLRRYHWLCRAYCSARRPLLHRERPPVSHPRLGTRRVSLLLAADSAAKLVVPPIILPIGAIMSFIGGPVFLFLLFWRKYD